MKSYNRRRVSFPHIYDAAEFPTARLFSSRRNCFDAELVTNRSRKYISQSIQEESSLRGS